MKWIEMNHDDNYQPISPHQSQPSCRWSKNSLRIADFAVGATLKFTVRDKDFGTKDRGPTPWAGAMRSGMEVGHQEVDVTLSKGFAKERQF